MSGMVKNKSQTAHTSSIPVTPMMAQYLEIKAQYQDYLLFFRMGDFYELFFEDAIKAADILDIVLTKRGKHGGEEIPMCGVPWHQCEAYMEKLIRSGFSVAVCDQVETPEAAKKRGGNKAVVKREVIRLVTPGTLTEENLLDGRQNNYLTAIAKVADKTALAWLDISTGEFVAQVIETDSLPAALARLNSREVLIPDTLARQDKMRTLLTDWNTVLKAQPDVTFNSQNAEQRLRDLFGIKTLQSFGVFSRAEVAAAGALVNYVELTQKGKVPQINRLSQMNTAGVLEIDPASLRNLEILQTLEGKKQGSLLATIDHTLTAAGARLMAARLAAPLTDIEKIKYRQQQIAILFDQQKFHRSLRSHLADCPDMERALSRLSLNRGSPRDMAAIHGGLEAAFHIKESFRKSGIDDPSLRDVMDALGGFSEMIDELKRALKENLPFLARDGGFIKTGYYAPLDEFRSLRDESRKHISRLQTDYIKKTGVTTLKIKHNNVLGYFAEVTPKNADQIGEPFIHRQTLASAVRFTTPELAELEAKLSKADDQALAVELELFDKLSQMILEQAEKITTAARAIAALDVAGSFAELARLYDYRRPDLCENTTFDIKGGRHPVVERALKQVDEQFIANDASLSPGENLRLLTGPNMAGKSTYLRQNALIVLLAQMGGYVPAQSATIGIVDKLFSRVGAADDLARGRSTFMVEMIETATILNQATDKSFVILDEIGRGTATFDGLSIAWGVLEYLHDVVKCRAVFATHYHELTSLAAKLENLNCYTMRVKEWQDSIVFLHEVIAGQADRSYGIHVAELAGLPKAVTARANQVLKALEEGEQGAATTKLAEDLPLFQTTLEEAKPARPHPLVEKMNKINPDTLTPRQALEILYDLKAQEE